MLCIIQATTILHELAHALLMLLLTDSHVVLLVGSTNQNNGVKISLSNRFDIELKGFLPGVGMIQWDKNNELSDFQKALTFVCGPLMNLALFSILLAYTKAVGRLKQSFLVAFTMNYALLGFLVTIVPIIYPKMWIGYGGLQSDGYQLLQLLMGR